MDQPKLERMLRLMQLLASNTHYSIDDLAEKLDMSYRTIYRYLDTFRSAGFAVTKLHGNVYKLGAMPSGTVDFDNLIYFSEEEAYLVNNLIDRLDPTNALKVDLKRKLAAIYNSTSIADYVDKGRNAGNVQLLSDAIKKKKKVILKSYESARSGSIKDRIVEPFGFTTNYIDVWAYDLGDFHNKLFKLARIGDVVVCEESWECESNHRKQGMDIFRMAGKTAKRVKLLLSVRAKNLLLEEYPLAERDLRAAEDGWLLETDIYNYAGACRFYVGLAGEISIVDSPEFKAYVDNYIREELLIDKTCQ